MGQQWNEDNMNQLKDGAKNVANKVGDLGQHVYDNWDTYANKVGDFGGKMVDAIAHDENAQNNEGRNNMGFAQEKLASMNDGMQNNNNVIFQSQLDIVVKKIFFGGREN